MFGFSKTNSVILNVRINWAFFGGISLREYLARINCIVLDSKSQKVKCVFGDTVDCWKVGGASVTLLEEPDEAIPEPAEEGPPGPNRMSFLMPETKEATDGPTPPLLVGKPN